MSISITDRNFTSQIKGTPAYIFDLIADLPNYGLWLPDSAVFGGTIHVTPYPVRLGTTYLDAPPVEKPGSVTEFDPPKHIRFHQTVLIKKGLVKANVDADIRYSFEPNENGTFVVRRLVLSIDINRIFKLALPFLRNAFYKENIRTLAALKKYVESQNV